MCNRSSNPVAKPSLPKSRKTKTARQKKKKKRLCSIDEDNSMSVALLGSLGRLGQRSSWTDTDHLIQNAARARLPHQILLARNLVIIRATKTKRQISEHTRSLNQIHPLKEKKKKKEVNYSYSKDENGRASLSDGRLPARSRWLPPCFGSARTTEAHETLKRHRW